MRKSAMEFAEGRVEKILITKKEVEHYLGKPIFVEEELFKGSPGVVTGLAWTRLGGATLQIEATAMQSKSKGFKQTGQLGKVMVESSEIAYSYVMGHLEQYKIPADYFDSHFIHMHVPAGATPKDGPSAGITMTTALLSMIMKKAIRKKLGMTGELSLTGRVLPIGGVKEKTIAARRAGLKALIFPHDNKKDYEDLPDYLREGIEAHFVKEYPDVFKIAFANPKPIPLPAAGNPLQADT
jgi:ATP-dependent Lon protease